MRSNLLKIGFFLGVLLIPVLIYLWLSGNNPQKLVSPNVNITPTPIKSDTDFIGSGQPAPANRPTPTPQVFRFDKSTNLKRELESVNPRVSDDGFEGLKKLISSL